MQCDGILIFVTIRLHLVEMDEFHNNVTFTIHFMIQFLQKYHPHYPHRLKESNKNWIACDSHSLTFLLFVEE